MPNGDDHDLLQRIDERVQLMRTDIASLRSEVEASRADYSSSRERCAKMFADMFVTRVEFDPVRKVVYGTVGVILLSVLGAVIGLTVHG